MLGAVSNIGAVLDALTDLADSIANRPTRQANVTVVRGRVADAGKTGVILKAGGVRVLLEGMRISGGKLSGASVEPESELTMRGCTVADNHGRGVLTCLGSSVEIDDLTSVRNGKPDRFDFDLNAGPADATRRVPAEVKSEAPAKPVDQAPVEPKRGVSN